jgi:hypothetical protein
MKKKLVILLILMQVIVIKSFGQNNSITTDSVVPDNFKTSSLNLSSGVLMKSEMLVRMNFDFTEYKRTLNTLTGNMEKLPDNEVLNEMLISTYIDYGISRKLTLYTQLPVSDIHHYSPKGVDAYKGLADIGLGGDYLLMNNNSGSNTLTGEATVFIPTGNSSSSTTDNYLPGIRTVRLKGSLTGMKKSGNSVIIYSGYYEFRPVNSSDLNAGDELGITVIRQDDHKTKFGNFGIEYGGFSLFKTEDKNNGIKIPHTADYEIAAFAGGWFKYRNNLILRFGLPYTIYQNGSPLTKYDVLFQLDYRFKF